MPPAGHAVRAVAAPNDDQLTVATQADRAPPVASTPLGIEVDVVVIEGELDGV